MAEQQPTNTKAFNTRGLTIYEGRDVIHSDIVRTDEFRVRGMSLEQFDQRFPASAAPRPRQS